jgi:hypothetical protein
MKQVNNFAGLNGFVWWIGVVENRMDPLQVGRCQIRIFGWHSPDNNLVPSADLPWALPIYSLNGAKAFSTPKEGDYVMGFFLDGESGQFPAMMGWIPGLQGAAPAGDAGFQDPRTPAQIAAAPQQPAGQVVNTPGQPTVAPLARGDVANSAISATNSARSAVKDITTPIKATLAAAKLEALAFVQEIRAAKDAIIASFTPPGTGPGLTIASDATQATNQLKAYAQEAKAAIDAANQVQAAIAEVQAAVTYIESLPAATIAEINSEVNLPGQTGGLLNTIQSSASSTISNLTKSIKL